MDPTEQDGNGAPEALPPPPPVPPNVTPLKVDSEPEVKKVLRVPMARRGLGTKGNKVPILTNHFKVNVKNVDGYFFHYSVALFYEDGRPVDGKGVGRKVLDRVQETYDTELAGKEFAYDGEKSLFTVGALPRNKLEFTVVLEDVTSSRNTGNASPGGHGSPNETDRKRIRRPYQSKTFKVEISYAAKIPMQAIANALRGQESENSQEALRVLDIILRQHAAKQGCLLVRQSFFHNDPKNFAEVGGGVLGCRGFHSSFRTTQSGLSLNIDVSTTMIIQPGPVADFLIANQGARDPFSVDWAKKSKDGDGEVQTTEVTVYDYFVKHRNIDLRYSADLPCINVGRPKRPTYFPVELCSLVSLQRYTKALSTFQRSALVEKSRQKPQERMSVLSNKFVNACKVERWAVVNFSARCDVRGLIRDLIKVGEMKGITVEAPFDVFEENQQFRRAPPLVRVEKMLEQVQEKLPGPPKFLLCLLPERKNCDIYGPWKRKNLSDFGVVTQCLAPQRVNDQYLTNLLLKINAKVVSSRQWPSISRYRACVRTQSAKVEMIDSLYKRVSDTEDDGIMRDGVSESQFNQVLNIELDQIIEACKFLDEKWNPKFVVIVAQKNHHTKFFQPNSPDNVQPVAPICYAHLAATQLGQWMKFEDASETSSSHNGTGPGGAPPVPPMPKLHGDVRNSISERPHQKSANNLLNSLHVPTGS
ncbi:hypothetical protein DH2020_000913 [Rehmannia glutinosa]|uniref:Uncharacterized protein n=1 Tax=Rehmannia glutinosa TaxID=99300 RepID=A0ABR0XY56_REHGL